MRFFDVLGNLKKGRRSVSKPSSVSEQEVSDPVKLAEMLRQLSLRVQELEARLPQEAVEFERDITGTTAGGVVHRFDHNLGVPVRWYVVHWSGSAVVHPALVYSATSTDKSLVLTSYSAGRVVLRIEPSQNGVS